eukprot:829589-Pelagomonas_calceolata.AAC.7
MHETNREDGKEENDNSNKIRAQGAHEYTHINIHAHACAHTALPLSLGGFTGGFTRDKGGFFSHSIWTLNRPGCCFTSMETRLPHN